MLVVGETGKAVLYDIDMSSPGCKKKNIPEKNWKNSHGIRKWDFIKKLNAHNIGSNEETYVVTCKFIKQARIYVTGTTQGEVKLFDDTHLTELGVLNSIEWDLTKDSLLQRHLRGESIVDETEGLKELQPMD